MPPDEIPKLRMAPRESAEELQHRFEREQRAVDLHRESALENSLIPFRVGSVPYLNAAPLTRGLEDQIEFLPPIELAEKLRRQELEAALLSVTEVLFTDAYDILDGIAIASLGEVYSVILAHRQPIEEAREIFCDPASLTSVNLLKVLLAERGLSPEFRPLPSYGPPWPDYTLLIGNSAIDFRRQPHDHQIFDLGAAWYELTRLPFVYAVWALRRDLDTTPLRRQLREARTFGLDTLDYLIEHGKEYDASFRKDYLGWHIHYHLGADEKRGLAKFIDLLGQHTTRQVYPPRFVA